MKRKLFAGFFCLLSCVIMYGWTYLPESIFYAHKSSDPHIYTGFGNIWAYSGVFISVALSVVMAYKTGEYIFDWLNKK